MKNLELNKNILHEILLKNLKREYNTYSKNGCFSNSAWRFNMERIPDKKNIRQSFFHDTDKIIHSLAYTRYIDKTQVFYLFENDHITHRVLHVQLVSKIGRVIGRSLSLNEDLIEAISLAHDLGHVPYGHDGERKLDELTFNSLKEHFIHSSQSARAMMYLENQGRGLNLTLQVLDGILCHNGEFMLQEFRPKYNKTPKDFLLDYHQSWIDKDAPKKMIAMTLEGCVMRISDVIAYIGRDLEDAIMLGLIKRQEVPKEVKDVIGDSNGSIINNIVIDLINNSYGENYLKLSDEVHEAIRAFSTFSIAAIYQNPKKSTEDEKIKNMFEVLFNKYNDDLKSGKMKTSITKNFLVNMNVNYRDNTPNPRIACDYIAGMTDDFFNKEFKNFMIPDSFGYKIK
jgi:dGTPase